jgi:hypothetical protein
MRSRVSRFTRPASPPAWRRTPGPSDGVPAAALPSADRSPRAGASVLDIALHLAARFGLPVFPCGGNKRPVIAEGDGGHGCLDATTDAQAIRALFAKAGKAAKLVGVPTGPRSGVDVMDIDPRHGGDAWEPENLASVLGTRRRASRTVSPHIRSKRLSPARRSSSTPHARCSCCTRPTSPVRRTGGSTWRSRRSRLWSTEQRPRCVCWWRLWSR